MADPSGRGRRGRRARRASPPGPATDRGGDGTGGECAAVSFLKNDSKHELALRSGEGRLPERRARSAGCVFGEKSSRSLLFTFRKNQFPMDDRSKCDNENAFGRERESSSCGPSGGRPLRRGAAGTRGDPGWAAVEGLRVSGAASRTTTRPPRGVGGAHAAGRNADATENAAPSSQEGSLACAVAPRGPGRGRAPPEN